MLLHGEVGVALEEEQILAQVVRFGEPFFNVPEFQVDELVEIAQVSVVVDAGLGSGQRVFRGGNRGKHLVLDRDQVDGRGSGFFRGRGHGRNRIPDESGLVGTEGMLVLAHREDAEGNGEVLPGEYGLHALGSPGLAGVDADDAGVRVGASQELGVEHPRE